MGSSISTTRGDNGQTGLAGGIRVSKASLRVDAYGNVDELNSTLGFARSICEDAEIAELSKRIQPDLLWIVGRKLEYDAGVSGSLREITGKAGNRFSRAW